MADPDNPNDPSYNWVGYLELDEGHEAYILPDTVSDIHITELSELTKRDVKNLTATQIRAMYVRIGLEPFKASKKAALQNALWALSITAYNRQQAALPKIAQGPITDAERIKMVQMEDEILLLRKRLRENDGEDVNVRPIKRQTKGMGKKEMELGTTADDGTLTFLDTSRNPLRLAFFDKGAYGHRGEGHEPPSAKNVTEYLKTKMRSLDKPLSLGAVSKIVNFDFATVDITDYAKEDMTSVMTDRKSFDCAIGLLMDVIGIVHGSGIAKRTDEFKKEVEMRTGDHWTIDVLHKYVTKCLKHFAADMQDIYDDWTERDGDAPREIGVPRIGRSVNVEATENIIKHVEGKRFENMQNRMLEAVKEAVAKEVHGRGSWGKTGRRGEMEGNNKEGGGASSSATKGTTTDKRRINGAKIPADSKGKRLCVSNSESAGCKVGSRCRWSHERTLTKEELDAVFA
jgi:hypothetical protein